MFIQSHMVSSESNNITTSGKPAGNCTLSGIGHSGSFNVILIRVDRNPEWGVIVMHNNANLISETYKNIAAGKLQIRLFHNPMSRHVTTSRDISYIISYIITYYLTLKRQNYNTMMTSLMSQCHNIGDHCIKRPFNCNKNCQRRSILKVMTSSGHVTTSVRWPLNSTWTTMMSVTSPTQ